MTQLISYDAGYSPGAFSPDGSLVAVSHLRFDDPEGGVDLWKIDHAAVFSRITDTAGAIDESHPVWSPDGASIAYFSEGEVYRVDADGTDATQLTSDPDYDESPTWSPDSASIAFNTGRAGDGDKWVMNADGTEQRSLIAMPGGEGRADWTGGSIVPLGTAEAVSAAIGREAASRRPTRRRQTSPIRRIRR